ncbi:response regulator transcription factor [Kriegella aquimaris]|uniref:Two component transcriptional regulator, LuxR family n=1 Tax=Kriegella aquimaris TaxID=192904 RepID=A0A1G9NF99_9FLAO|nr:response regulator transcription factor [Kriegella aquimaris]SDL85119.1 two component transcriptional regulator, LuxR family [Kriegella aquimaris]
MESDTLKIIVIDNDAVSHVVYQHYFETFSDYSLDGIYSSVKEALKNYDTIKPDIIVSEVNMPEITGIEGIRLFRKKDPNVKIIMVSDESDFDFIKNAFKNGANGYMTKPINGKRLYNALDSIRHEGAAMSNDIAKKVISMFQRKSYKSFSERENQIIDYLCQGATYKMIADKLFVTTSAINFHIQNIYLKLNVNSKAEAITKLQQLEYA